MKVEFHCHTNNSHDCSDDLNDKIRIYKNLGFDKIYITDHDEVFNVNNSSFCAHGIEVSSTLGHIILLDCKKKPPLNTLWFLVLWAKVYNSKISIPHSNRQFTGLIERYNNKGFGRFYLNWFLQKSKYIEYYNHRDRNNLRVEIIEEKTFNIILNLEGIYTSDSHNLTDIYTNGTIINKENVHVLDKEKYNRFKNSFKVVSTKIKINFLILFFNFILTIRRSLIYMKNGKL